MKVQVLVIVALLLRSTITLFLRMDLDSHKFFSSFFGELTFQDRPQNWGEEDYNWQNYQDEDQSQSQILLINGEPYYYKGPFILYCYDSDNDLIRQDKCSNQERCLHLINQYKKCQGNVNYQLLK